MSLPVTRNEWLRLTLTGMMSPLLGIAAVNSLLFTAYGASRRLVSPYPDLSVQQVALAGSMAGAVNAVLASPVSHIYNSQEALMASIYADGSG